MTAAALAAERDDCKALLLATLQVSLIHDNFDNGLFLFFSMCKFNALPDQKLRFRTHERSALTLMRVHLLLKAVHLL